MKVKYGIVFALGATLISCDSQEHVSPEVKAEEAKTLMEQQCYSCHNTQGTDNMLAPPMFRVKDHYYSEDVSRSEFVEAIVDWVKDPKEENSVMPGARRKFGLMPKQNFKEADVRKIAEYMYDNDL
jgi:hypothetical protein